MSGFEKVNPHHIRAAIECELTRLIAEKGVAALTSAGDSRSMTGKSFQMHQGENSFTIGKRTARAIYEGVAHPPDIQKPGF